MDKSPPEPTDAERAHLIAAALRVYSHIFDGQYPRGRFVHPGREADKVSARLGLDKGYTISNEQGNTDPETVRKLEQEFRDKHEQYQTVRKGLYEMAKLLTHNQKSAYFGRTVTKDETQRVLLYWKSDDGFQVMFGDLRTQWMSNEEFARTVK